MIERTVQDPCGGWAHKRQVQPCGALLVRPDGHVAWRCEKADPAASVDDLARALGSALEATLALAPHTVRAD